MQTAPYAVIAMGVTFALLLGEIDLSIGFVSGVGGVLVALLLLPDGNEMRDARRRSPSRCSPASASACCTALIITKIGVPSFVVTLAGLLAWNGVVLLLIGSRGTVILQNEFVIGLANDFMAPGRGLGAVGGLRRALRRSCSSCGCATARRPGLADRPDADRRAADRRARGRARRSSSPSRTRTAASRTSALLVGALLVFWTYVLNRTRFGRHVYAVGGNQEARAARRHQRRPGQDRLLHDRAR